MVDLDDVRLELGPIRCAILDVPAGDNRASRCQIVVNIMCRSCIGHLCRIAACSRRNLTYSYAQTRLTGSQTSAGSHYQSEAAAKAMWTGCMWTRLFASREETKAARSSMSGRERPEP